MPWLEQRNLMVNAREEEEEDWITGKIHRRGNTTDMKGGGLTGRRSSGGAGKLLKGSTSSICLFLLLLSTKFGVCYPTWGLARAQQCIGGRESALLDVFTITCILLRLRGGAEDDIAMNDALKREAQDASAGALTALTKQQLRDELQRRGCDVLGAKSVLQIRLERVLKEEDPVANVQATPMVSGEVLQKVDQEMMDVDATGAGRAGDRRTIALSPTDAIRKRPDTQVLIFHRALDRSLDLFPVSRKPPRLLTKNAGL
ncbi:hypothetical protein GUITHDRAFT_139874 [Guillardia theta CCMP2712]|uniref:SAP domain-containing protein n=1 Tax=Guillardia theta (strain CCMP2712) TaxID=905079 RepID=L1J744_GUITC|nr:hypothetical protein GUITHDRAFT_139874 [Guillardia theta CCMP2712]EKX44331.1 hypothetical protein GUITHDRAFT_139874 [Guillardia theta CCMP2712]|eukprot:XP_005831311.1 hypothetical protein GUITHDRAFT_139874 [Guillardia theta CCMP2712]